MFHLSLIWAVIVGFSSDPYWVKDPNLQDGKKNNKHFLIGFENDATDDGDVNYYSNSLLRTLEISARGEVELTDNDLDIKRVAPDGFVIIKERNWMTYRSIRFTSTPGGNLERVYTIQGREYEFDDEARSWYTQIMMDAARETGLGAKHRIKRIIDQKGIRAAIREIEYVSSNSIKQLYFQTILSQPDLSSEELQKAVETIVEEISSSSRLGNLLIATAKNFPDDAVLTESLIRAVRNISSSSKQSAVLIQIAESRRINNASAIAMAEAIKTISSSSAQGAALKSLAGKCSPDYEVVSAYVNAVRSVSSSSVQGSALKALLRKSDLEDDAYMVILDCVEQISSSSVQGDVLEDLAAVSPANDAVMSAYLKCVSTVSSSSVQGQAIMSMLDKPGLSTAILSKTMRFTEEISSSSVRDMIVRKVTDRMPKR
jgi:hypothetical protein